MKSSLLALFCLCVLAPLQADTASHRKAADELLTLVAGPETLRAGFQVIFNPTLATMRQQGASEAQLRDVQAAFNDWVAKELLWEDLKPKIVDVYVHEFTEAELKDLVAFYKSPVGAKSLKRLPAAAAEASKIAQLYAQTKQAGLVSRLNKSMEPYAPKK